MNQSFHLLLKSLRDFPGGLDKTTEGPPGPTGLPPVPPAPGLGPLSHLGPSAQTVPPAWKPFLFLFYETVSCLLKYHFPCPLAPFRPWKVCVQRPKLCLLAAILVCSSSFACMLGQRQALQRLEALRFLLTSRGAGAHYSRPPVPVGSASRDSGNQG